jgi:hypothetical protein
MEGLEPSSPIWQEGTSCLGIPTGQNDHSQYKYIDVTLRKVKILDDSEHFYLKSPEPREVLYLKASSKG